MSKQTQCSVNAGLLSNSLFFVRRLWFFGVVLKVRGQLSSSCFMKCHSDDSLKNNVVFGRWWSIWGIRQADQLFHQGSRITFPLVTAFDLVTPFFPTYFYIYCIYLVIHTHLIVCFCKLSVSFVIYVRAALTMTFPFGDKKKSTLSILSLCPSLYLSTAYSIDTDYTLYFALLSRNLCK